MHLNVYQIRLVDKVNEAKTSLVRQRSILINFSRFERLLN